MKKIAKRSLAMLLALITLFSCVGVSASAATTGYEATRITCTMNGNAKTRRGFTWYTKKSCDTAIQVVTKAEYDANGFSKAKTIKGETFEWQGYYGHKVVVKSLKAGTTYKYRVGTADKKQWSSVGTFVTDNGDNKFSFIAIADVQASSLENFKEAATVMNKAMSKVPNAEFVVNLGDFVNDCTNEEWDWYGQAFKKANTNLTLVPVAGNHEGNITNKLNVGWFANMFNLKPGEGDLNNVNGVYYSFDYGDVHFTVLNSNDMYPMTEAQRNWVYNDLTKTKAQWKVLLLHRAAYSAGKNINKPDTLVMRKTIIEIVDDTGVDLVLSGHDHMYFRTFPVKDDKVCKDTLYVTEKYKGVDTTFAVNPEGAVYALPSTAGTKRYGVNDGTLKDVMDAADACFTTRSEKTKAGKETNPNAGGCFAQVDVDGDRLIYKAYVVNDDTKAVKLVDQFAIKKNVADKDVADTKLPTDIIGSLDGSVANLLTELAGVIVTYIGKLLPQFVVGLFK